MRQREKKRKTLFTCETTQTDSQATFQKENDKSACRRHCRVEKQGREARSQHTCKEMEEEASKEKKWCLDNVSHHAFAAPTPCPTTLCRENFICCHQSHQASLTRCNHWSKKMGPVQTNKEKKARDTHKQAALPHCPHAEPNPRDSSPPMLSMCPSKNASHEQQNNQNVNSRSTGQSVSRNSSKLLQRNPTPCSARQMNDKSGLT